MLKYSGSGIYCDTSSGSLSRHFSQNTQYPEAEGILGNNTSKRIMIHLVLWFLQHKADQAAVNIKR